MASAQQAQQNIQMTIDPMGNAKIHMNMTMNAQQWQNWNATLGSNPAALKRQVERGMPAFFLDEFKLEKDEMNRSFALSLNAYGVCDIDKRATWTLDVDQENAQLTKLNESKYMFVSSPEEFGRQIQQNYTINFPENAQDIKVDKNAFGRDIFKFKMKAPRRMTAGLGGLARWGGLVLVIAGIVWTAKNMWQTKKS